jgi:GGDEF domain-containing protein
MALPTNTATALDLDVVRQQTGVLLPSHDSVSLAADAKLRLLNILQTSLPLNNIFKKFYDELSSVLCIKRPAVCQRTAEYSGAQRGYMTHMTAHIADTHIRTENGSTQITASIGAASYCATDTEESLINRSDKAMYEVKRSGGNKINWL